MLTRSWWRIAAVLSLAACSGRTDAQRVCEDYARTFADVAAGTCRRGGVETNVAAFKSAARVGAECELVLEIRDVDALESECFSWLRDDLSQDCALLDSPRRYVEALPDSCKAQLKVLED